MARLTKTEATRQLGISRTPLYKLIDQGKVSATPDGLIDETELGRAAPYVDILKERSRPSRDTEDVDMDSSHDEQRERPSEPGMNNRGRVCMHVSGRSRTPWGTSCVNSCSERKSASGSTRNASATTASISLS